MRGCSIKLHKVLISSACFLLVSASCLAQFKHQPTSGQVHSLRQFLQDYVDDSEREKGTRYDFAFVDLKDDGAYEVIVYFSGNSWCGSGGCTTLILAPDGSSYRVVTKITVARPPIRVLKMSSNGWHNISVRVRGGGIQPGYEAELKFNGTSYPANPSVPPAREVKEKLAGQVVVSDQGEGTPLYQ
jgi:hypothetical protein